ncbi:MAG: sensor histidine kinase [Lachnospiraceae bacterium]
MKDNTIVSLRLKLAWYILFSVFLVVMTDAIIVCGVFLYKREILSQMDATMIKMIFIKLTPSMSKYLIFDLGIFILFSVLLFLFYFLILTNNMINYLREVAAGVRRMRDGDLESKIKVKGKDEISQIAYALNEMQVKLKTNQEIKQQAEQTKDELITNVAHDLRTPLTSIIGYLDLVRRDAILTPEQQKKYIGIAYDKSKSLERLIEALFDYTRYDKQKVVIRPKKIDFCQFIMQISEEFYPSFSEKQIECKMEIPKHPIYVNVDGELMARAIGNLISNAIKYGADGKQVRMKIEKTENNKVKFSIINYGKVISEKDLEQIFDKFYRVEQSRSAKTGGTGLGLAIAKNIVKLHDGTIQAKSDINGTIFEILLEEVL